MAKTKSAPRNKKGLSRNASMELMIFQGPVAPSAPGTVQLQSLSSLSDKLFGRKVADVQADFDRIADQLTHVLASSFSKVVAGMAIETVEVELGFTAEGQLAFVAKAGLETSITLTFKRVP